MGAPQVAGDKKETRRFFFCDCSFNRFSRFSFREDSTQNRGSPAPPVGHHCWRLFLGGGGGTGSASGGGGRSAARSASARRTFSNWATRLHSLGHQRLAWMVKDGGISDFGPPPASLRHRSGDGAPMGPSSPEQAGRLLERRWAAPAGDAASQGTLTKPVRLPLLQAYDVARRLGRAPLHSPAALVALERSHLSRARARA
jgi:hypothetical protein